jgi:hypothetical protein
MYKIWSYVMERQVRCLTKIGFKLDLIALGDRGSVMFMEPPSLLYLLSENRQSVKNSVEKVKGAYTNKALHLLKATQHNQTIHYHYSFLDDKQISLVILSIYY